MIAQFNIFIHAIDNDIYYIITFANRLPHLQLYDAFIKCLRSG